MSDCNQFAILNKTAEISKSNIFVITGNEARLLPHFDNSLLRKTLKVVELIICHVELGRKITNNKSKDAIIVHGFSTEFLIFTYIASFFWAKNVYCLTHHNIKQAFQNSLVRLIFKMYHHLDYKFIVNEDSSILKNLGFSDREIEQHISLRHPAAKVDSFNLFINDESIEHSESNEIKKRRISIVGKIRPGKQFHRTLELSLKLQEKLNFSLVIGTDDLSSFDRVNLNGAILVDTSKNENYFAVLSSCEIIILNYEKAKYFYRCSGVGADAIGTRTYVICPNFPMMNHQLRDPEPVGILYENESDLENAIQQALKLPPADTNDAFDRHHIERSIEKLASILDRDIQARINTERAL